jgi:hypothetical protein
MSVKYQGNSILHVFHESTIMLRKQKYGTAYYHLNILDVKI